MPDGYTGSWGNKDPSAKKDYDLDWSSFLGTATISNSDWTIVQGSVEMILDENDFSDIQTKVVLQGGTANETCLIRNTVTCSDGRRDSCTMRLDVRTQ
jgi:hypothetical protein